MKTEQEIKHVYDRCESIFDRLENLTDHKMLEPMTAEQLMRASYTCSTLCSLLACLGWTLGKADAEQIPAEARAKHYVSIDEYLDNTEKFINEVYSARRAMEHKTKPVR